MAKTKTVYLCQSCNAQTPKWMGQCPNCNEWNTLVESLTNPKKKSWGVDATSSASGTLVHYKDVIISSDRMQRASTRIGELDRVLGGGIVPGSVVLIAGEPGIGKSTLLTQLSVSLAGNQTQNSKVKTTNQKEKGRNQRQVQRSLAQEAGASTRHGSFAEAQDDSQPINGLIDSPTTNSPVIYVSGEESPEQVKLRVARLAGDIPLNLSLLPETNVDAIASAIQNLAATNRPSLVIVDSIQTLYTEELMGMAGSAGQVRESAQRLLTVAKRHNIPVFIVGHVTKEGAIAGPKVLEHLVDAVLELTGERTGMFRILRAVKNRFGATDEVGVFEMAGEGLREISNPSQAFLEESQQGVPGSAITAVMEGTRPILVEIQALVVPSQLAMPRRVVHGVSLPKVQLLAAVLQKRCGLAGLGTSDIFVNVAGGIKIDEPAADLGIALALASSLVNKPLPSHLVAVGEVGLLGEIRKVPRLEKRLSEAKSLGYGASASPQEYRFLREAVTKLLKGK